MKLIIVYVLYFSSVFAWASYYKKQDIFKEWDKLLAIHRDECIKESGVYKEDAYDIEKIATFPNYRGFKCYLKCQRDRLQVLDAKGELSHELIIRNIDPTKLTVDEKRKQLRAQLTLEKLNVTTLDKYKPIKLVDKLEISETKKKLKELEAFAVIFENTPTYKDYLRLSSYLMYLYGRINRLSDDVKDKSEY
ncbi:hypothetical protein FQA39_LY18272 [Lamprigera yunnana]|nr:hypothetical protein FQA39_LY18272 [Lamprigera yunnana]